MLASCEGTVEDLVDDYNSTFKKTSGNTIVIEDLGSSVLSPGDPGFDPSLMLRDQYVISSKTLFQIGAPYRCTRYEWTISDKTGTKISYQCYQASEVVTACTERTLLIYIPYSRISCGSYTLKLSITGGDGEEYEDSATLIIYEALD